MIIAGQPWRNVRDITVEGVQDMVDVKGWAHPRIIWIVVESKSRVDGSSTILIHRRVASLWAHGSEAESKAQHGEWIKSND